MFDFVFGAFVIVHVFASVLFLVCWQNDKKEYNKKEKVLYHPITNFLFGFLWTFYLVWYAFNSLLSLIKEYFEIVNDLFSEEK